MARKEKACRTCRAVMEGDVKECSFCKNNTFTTFWRGYVVVINPEQSEIAQKMGVKKDGKFALRLSR